MYGVSHGRTCTKDGRTERSSAIHPIYAQEKPLAQGDSLEHVATLAHRILLLLDVLHPFSLGDVRARPERDLVVLAAEVDEGDREPALGVLDGHDGRVGRVLDQLLLACIHRLLVLRRVVVRC